MKPILKHNLLDVPLLIWGLQLIYVIGMLGLLTALVFGTKLHERSLHTKLMIVVPYIIVMIFVDIAWRVAIKKHLADWF